MSKLEGYILYHMPACPFCVKVRNVLDEIGKTVELRDINEANYKQELIEGGGQSMVPCLKHPDGKFQYESADIAEFLRKNFS